MSRSDLYEVDMNNLMMCDSRIMKMVVHAYVALCYGVTNPANSASRQRTSRQRRTSAQDKYSGLSALGQKCSSEDGALAQPQHAPSPPHRLIRLSVEAAAALSRQAGGIALGSSGQPLSSGLLQVQQVLQRPSLPAQQQSSPEASEVHMPRSFARQYGLFGAQPLEEAGTAGALVVDPWAGWVQSSYDPINYPWADIYRQPITSPINHHSLPLLQNGLPRPQQYAELSRDSLPNTELGPALPRTAEYFSSLIPDLWGNEPADDIAPPSSRIGLVVGPPKRSLEQRRCSNASPAAAESAAPRSAGACGLVLGSSGQGSSSCGQGASSDDMAVTPPRRIKRKVWLPQCVTPEGLRNKSDFCGLNRQLFQ